MRKKIIKNTSFVNNEILTNKLERDISYDVLFTKLSIAFKINEKDGFLGVHVCFPKYTGSLDVEYNLYKKNFKIIYNTTNDSFNIVYNGKDKSLIIYINNDFCEIGENNKDFYAEFEKSQYIEKIYLKIRKDENFNDLVKFIEPQNISKPIYEDEFMEDDAFNEKIMNSYKVTVEQAKEIVIFYYGPERKTINDLMVIYKKRKKEMERLVFYLVRNERIMKDMNFDWSIRIVGDMRKAIQIYNILKNEKNVEKKIEESYREYKYDSDIYNILKKIINKHQPKYIQLILESAKKDLLTNDKNMTLKKLLRKCIYNNNEMCYEDLEDIVRLYYISENNSIELLAKKYDCPIELIEYAVNKFKNGEMKLSFSRERILSQDEFKAIIEYIQLSKSNNKIKNKFDKDIIITHIINNDVGITSYGQNIIQYVKEHLQLK